ncbi:MAG: putative toxin-antitoxin system toxin component, PIN family [Gemmatimonadetes bacterium]|nr:putative toxin-antitoxin system toxin component, PIN family [Gemmatimonadota bacterium]
MRPRVVLDTNVVVSALVFQHGRLGWIRNAWTAGLFLPLASRATAEEILRVLTYPKHQLPSDDIGALLADYLPFVETVEIKSRRAVPDPPDPDDRIFLELAHAARAELLVTGDRGLLGMQSVGDCRIIAPVKFRAVLEGPGTGR